MGQLGYPEFVFAPEAEYLMPTNKSPWHLNRFPGAFSCSRASAMSCCTFSLCLFLTEK